MTPEIRELARRVFTGEGGDDDRAVLADALEILGHTNLADVVASRSTVARDVEEAWAILLGEQDASSLASIWASGDGWSILVAPMARAQEVDWHALTRFAEYRVRFVYAVTVVRLPVGHVREVLVRCADGTTITVWPESFEIDRHAGTLTVAGTTLAYPGALAGR